MGTGQYYLGVDVGSTATKAVLVDGSGAVLGVGLVDSGTDFSAAGLASANAALSAAGLDERPPTVATGYGRKNLAFASASVTEITCHARGILHYFPPPLTLVDIGGQDNKIIRIGSGGRVEDFSMNRKCAAGTGAFLEEMSRRLGLDMAQMDSKARNAPGEASIGSFCTVFASTEVLKLIREGRGVEEIARGAFRSVVRRVTEMGEFAGRVAVSGGVVAHNRIVASMLAEETGAPVDVPPDPQYIGALGGALIARERETGSEEKDG